MNYKILALYDSEFLIFTNLELVCTLILFCYFRHLGIDIFVLYENESNDEIILTITFIAGIKKEGSFYFKYTLLRN
jgi:hypothetical protein